MGTFENFLPALFAQRDQPGPLEYRQDMDPQPSNAEPQVGFDPALFQRRMEGYKSASNPSRYQAFGDRTFL